MDDLLSRPWPWYAAGPLIGLMVPVLLFIGNRQFGVGSNLRHICAALAPRQTEFFRYDWRSMGGWNLAFAAGIVVGGAISAQWLGSDTQTGLSFATRSDLTDLGIRSFAGLVPAELFSWESLKTVPGFVCIVIGGLFVGFGSAWAGGCTSGHAITGLADFQKASLIAVAAFFVGGLITTWVVFPYLFARG